MRQHASAEKWHGMLGDNLFSVVGVAYLPNKLSASDAQTRKGELHPVTLLYRLYVQSLKYASLSLTSKPTFTLLAHTTEHCTLYVLHSGLW